MLTGIPFSCQQGSSNLDSVFPSLQKDIVRLWSTIVRLCTTCSLATPLDHFFGGTDTVFPSSQVCNMPGCHCCTCCFVILLTFITTPYFGSSCCNFQFCSYSQSTYLIFSLVVDDFQGWSNHLPPLPPSFFNPMLGGFLQARGELDLPAKGFIRRSSPACLTSLLFSLEDAGIMWFLFILYVVFCTYAILYFYFVLYPSSQYILYWLWVLHKKQYKPEYKYKVQNSGGRYRLGFWFPALKVLLGTSEVVPQ